MNTTLSMVGSSHSAPVCDGSSISEHGREFSDMGSDTGFYGLGVPPQSRACRIFALPREAYTLPHQASDNPGQGRTHFFRAPTGHLQAILVGTPPSGLYLN